MGTAFRVFTTTHFDAMLKKLVAGHPDLIEWYARALPILAADPYNLTRRYHIKKLAGVAQGDAPWRLRLGRFRFRYDIEGTRVYLKACRLRSEDTYRGL